MVLLQWSSVVLHTFINMKIKSFKDKELKISTPSCSSNFMWFIIEIEALESIMLNALVIFTLVELSFVTNKINLMSPIESTFYPNYLYVNVHQLINPIIMVVVGTLIYFSQHSKMKMYFKRQWKEGYHCKV
jgi:hypothetical protein